MPSGDSRITEYRLEKKKLPPKLAEKKNAHTGGKEETEGTVEWREKAGNVVSEKNN